jgi:F-type H+-transporting ATPase subunit b
MKRFAPWVLFIALAAAPALCLAAGDQAAAKKEASEAESGKWKAWEWANFLVLAGGLGYLLGKNAGPTFDARSRKIRKDMVESEEFRKEAEERAAEVDRRLANLESEIAALRNEAREESEAEKLRYSRRTADEIAKVQVHSEQEIVAAGKAARMELKRYSAELAVELAEQKIRARMNPETQDALVRGFVRNLDSSSSHNT